MEKGKGCNNWKTGSKEHPEDKRSAVEETEEDRKIMLGCLGQRYEVEPQLQL